MPDWIRPLALVAGLLLTTGACASEGQVQEQETEEWGPLAVIKSVPRPDDVTGTATARAGPGTLTISDRCVVLSLREGAEVDLLVWGSAKTSWDAQEREIVFQDPGDGEIRLKDGDMIVVGGGGIGLDELESNTDWLAEPRSSCPTESLFSAGTVEVVED